MTNKERLWKVVQIAKDLRCFVLQKFKPKSYHNAYRVSSELFFDNITSGARCERIFTAQSVV